MNDDFINISYDTCYKNSPVWYTKSFK